MPFLNNDNKQSKICLGTAQFGLNYGVTNKSGKLSEEEIKKSLQIAFLNKISILDTSSSYGDAEKIIVSIIPKTKKFKVITKLKIPFISQLSDKKQKNIWDKLIYESLDRLKTQQLEGLLLHRASDLMNPKNNLLLEWLLEKKDQKITQKIGVSIYEEEDILEEHFEYLDIVQLPFSIYDQSKYQSGFLKKLQDSSIEVHARSLFLQGLILQQANLWPSWVNDKDLQIHKKFSEEIKFSKLNNIDVAIGWVYNLKFIDKLIVGFASSSELKDIIDSYKKYNSNLINFVPPEFSKQLLDPRQWP